MISFGIHFFVCNILIGAILGVLLLAKKFLGNYLSGCSQYRIWFLLPALFAMPFLSIRPAGFSEILHWFSGVKTALSQTDTAASLTAANPLSAADWVKDFHISVTRTSIPAAGYIPFMFWIGGMLVMTVFLIRSRIRLYRIEQSALPLQNQRVKKLYESCQKELHITQNIPIFSTAFLKSPIMVGMLRPRIYIPIHLISDLLAEEEKHACSKERYSVNDKPDVRSKQCFHETDIRYMLLHELQHYKHKDAFFNCLMNLALIVYWFNPVVWYVLKEVKADREIACDTFVLQMLDAGDYVHYGNTLLNFAQKVSNFPFSLAAGIGGNQKQIKKRILNIALYRPPGKCFKIREGVLFFFLIVLVLESTTLIPVLASGSGFSPPKEAEIHTDDLAGYFADYDGCFVLYDSNADTWDIYNETLAATRFPPNSTYKIYSALFALEQQFVTPADSSLAWDKNFYPFPEWNRDHDLKSAMQNSVNWYFQELDRRADFDTLKEFYRTIGYGNQDLSGGVSEFWMESSLRISAIEQVELLKKLYYNEFCFDSRNVQAVKDAMRLSASDSSVLSGKTGTGIVNGQSINGWFIGYVESEHNTWFFAVNIQGEHHADSLTASEIARSILADKNIYN